MNTHQNARLTPHSRAVLVRRVLEEGQTPKAAAAAFGVCSKNTAKWVARFQTEGIADLRDHSSRPHKLRHPTPEPGIHRSEALRRQRWTGQRIAAELGISPSTVSRTLHRLGLNRIQDIDTLPPPQRYERSKPGERPETSHLDQAVDHHKGEQHRYKDFLGEGPGSFLVFHGGSSTLQGSSEIETQPVKRAITPKATRKGAIVLDLMI